MALAVLTVPRKKKNPVVGIDSGNDETTTFTTIQVRKDLGAMIDTLVALTPGAKKHMLIDELLRPTIKKRLSDVRNRLDAMID